jgi:polysaccharide biosynthesis transport protein
MAELLQEVRLKYDYILLDTPPLVVPDFRLITDLVDGVVVVVAAHRTPRKLLEDALSQMNPANLMGIVFNGDDQRLSGYYGYYGYASGYYGASANGSRRREAWGRLLPSALTKVWRAFLG